MKLTLRLGKLIRTGGYQILIGIDMNRMINRLVQKGFCKDSRTHRPIAKSSFTVLTFKQIIDTYMIRGISNYYIPFISKCKDIIGTIYILEYSAYMTIAKKPIQKSLRLEQSLVNPLLCKYTKQKLEVKLKTLDKQLKQFNSLII